MTIIVRSAEEARRTGRMDRAKVEATTDAEIDRQIAEDPDTAPKLTFEQLKRGRRVRSLVPVKESDGIVCPL